MHFVRAAFAAIAVLVAGITTGETRPVHAYGRVMCAGPFCTIVPAAAPVEHRRAARPPSRTPMTHHHRGRDDRGGARHQRPATVTEVFDQDGRVRLVPGAPLRAPVKTAHRARRSGTPVRARPIGLAGASPIDTARRFLGGNPTGWGSVWCGRFMAMIFPQAAARLHNPAWARDWERLPHVPPQVGAVAVLHRGGGGHVGLVTGFDARGNPVLIAGNAGGNRVREYAVAARRVVAYVDPGG
jgi:uncharacterized protein (TIGR02594 family)